MNMSYLRAVSKSDDHTAVVWDLENMKKLMTLAGHTGVITSMAADFYSYRVTTGSTDRTVKVWDIEHKELIGTLEGHTDEVTSLNADNHDYRNSRVVSASLDRSLRIWNPE